MKENKINIHISDPDFYLKNVDIYNTEIRTTGSSYGRFIFTKYPKILIENVRFVNSRITLSPSVRNCVLIYNWFFDSDVVNRY